MAPSLLVLVALAGPLVPGAADLSVAILKPTASQIAYGQVEVVAEPRGAEPVTRVDFSVDGRPAGSVSRPPFRILVDVGQDNTEHLFGVVAHDASGRQASATVRTQRIAVDDEVQVTLQQLYVTVTANGAAIGDLRSDEFVVTDEGRRQQLVTFATGEIPFTAVLLVDASASMEGGKLESAIRGARAFAEGMQTLDETKLVVFSDRIRTASPFTSFPEILTAGLERIRAVGGTAINDVLFLALARLEERQGRRVVVLLSDGVDTHSALDMRHVVPVARRCRAIVYWIRTQTGEEAKSSEKVPKVTSAWRDQKGHRAEFEELRDLVAESGGHIGEVVSPAGIEPAFTAILSELRDHYVLGYYPSVQHGEGKWHRVRVDVDRRGVDVRTARGYVEH